LPKAKNRSINDYAVSSDLIKSKHVRCYNSGALARPDALCGRSGLDFSLLLSFHQGKESKRIKTGKDELLNVATLLMYNDSTKY